MQKQPGGHEGRAGRKAMAYTVNKVSVLSGVSVRTLHFYDETGLLKPAYVGANGYRYYEEPQLLTLQQILFYRELGFELKQIRRILGRADFEKIAALHSHRKVLEKNLARTRTLMETIDKTVQHLKGVKKMKSQEMFAGFSVAPGQARFGERITLGGEPNDCKVSGQDTGGAMCAFEFKGKTGGPMHLHHEQDEWIYLIAGELDFLVGEKRFRAQPGQCVFIPRKVAHVWACIGEGTGRIIDVYQPAGNIEEFFREVGKRSVAGEMAQPSMAELRRLFAAHGMDMVGPPLVGKWKVDEHGRAVLVSPTGTDY
ncbi:MAG: MerR family transcriptional regulator [Limisphaerales bacterium]